MLSPPTLTPQASNRVCNALALLQCVASHSETKNKLVKGTYLLFHIDRDTNWTLDETSQNPIISLSIPQYCFPTSSIRIFTPDFSRSDWRVGEIRRHRDRQLLVTN